MGREVFLYQVDFGAGERNVVSTLEPSWVSEHGLQPETVLAMVQPGADPAALVPGDVKENGLFLHLLSRVIWENIGRCEPVLRDASVQVSGHVYLLDQRTPDLAGRIPRHDIIGTVEVRDGQPVAGSYQHNPAHRLLSAAGWFRLPPDLEVLLQARLHVDTLH